MLQQQLLELQIYPSEFGLQRMKTEEVLGPVELQEEEPLTSEEAGEVSEYILSAVCLPVWPALYGAFVSWG